MTKGSQFVCGEQRARCQNFTIWGCEGGGQGREALKLLFIIKKGISDVLYLEYLQ